MTPTERERYLTRPATEYGRGPVLSILPSEIPPWALKLIIVTAIVLWLTW